MLAEAETAEQVLHAQLDLAPVALARRCRHDLYQLTRL